MLEAHCLDRSRGQGNRQTPNIAVAVVDLDSYVYLVHTSVHDNRNRCIVVSVRCKSDSFDAVSIVASECSQRTALSPICFALMKLRFNFRRTRRQKSREVANVVEHWLETHTPEHAVDNHGRIVSHIVDMIRSRCTAWSDNLASVRATRGLSSLRTVLDLQREIPVYPTRCTGGQITYDVVCVTFL